MNKFLSYCLLAALFSIGAATLSGAQSSTALLTKQTKMQQKIERKQLKLQEKIWERSFHGQHIPRAERLEAKHQYQRNLRELKLKQRDQLQAMKDQQRLMKYRSTHSLY